jgi:hypothetical protein
MRPRAVRDEGARDREAYAGGAGRHQHAPSFEGIFHGILPLWRR